MIKNKSVITLTILSLLVAGLFQTGTAKPFQKEKFTNDFSPHDTLLVCSTCFYKIIQVAIDDANPGDTIQLANELFEQVFTVDKNLTIQGGGATSTIVQAEEASIVATSRVLTVTMGISVTLKDLTVRNGSVSGVGIEGYGGGILNKGDLTLENAIVMGNVAEIGGGIANVSGVEDAHITIINSSIRENTANLHGAGIANLALQSGSTSAIAISNTTLSENYSDDAGGGIYNQASTGTASITINNSTFSTNSAESGGGGGIYNQSGTGIANLVIRQTTLAENAANSGSNLFLNGGSAEISQSILAYGMGSNDCQNSAGSITDGGYNLIEDGSCGFSVGGDPQLDILTDNGGDTKTRALRPYSPILDAIPSQFCDNTADQRGIARPFGAGCDPGAFELDETSLQFDHSLNTDPTKLIPGQVISFTLTAKPLGPGITNGQISTDLPTELNNETSIQLNPPGAGVIGPPPTLAHSVVISPNQMITLTLQTRVALGIAGGTSLSTQFWLTSTEVISPVVTTTTLTIINVPPVARNDSGALFTTPADQILTFHIDDLLANDSDDNGDLLLCLGDCTNKSGLIGILFYNTTSGIFTYNPIGRFLDLELGESAQDTFTYTITDGHGGLNTAAVTLTVLGTAGYPVFLPLVIKQP